jgi:hypothetical protein
LRATPCAALKGLLFTLVVKLLIISATLTFPEVIDSISSAFASINAIISDN